MGAAIAGGPSPRMSRCEGCDGLFGRPWRVVTPRHPARAPAMGSGVSP